MRLKRHGDTKRDGDGRFGNTFGFLSRRRPLDQVKYILWSLFLFLVVGIGIGWLMYPFSR